MKHSHLMEKNKLLCALCGINEELQFQQSRGDACSRKGGVGVGSDLRCLQFCGCEFMLQGFFLFLLVFLPPGCCCFTVGCTHASVLALMQCHLG